MIEFKGWTQLNAQKRSSVVFVWIITYTGNVMPVDFDASESEASSLPAVHTHNWIDKTHSSLTHIDKKAFDFVNTETWDAG